MTTKNLLVELLVEELPPKSLEKLGGSFAEALATSLKVQGLVPSDAAITAYATPRRLAVHITDVAAKAADRPVSQKLMPVSIGLDANGQATPALLKKLFSLGVNASVVPTLKRENDGKVDVLFLDTIIKGRSLVLGMQVALRETCDKLPIPKVMTYPVPLPWGDGWKTEDFVRPAHGLVVLHGDEIIRGEDEVSLLGLIAGRETQGHRFEAKINPIVLKDADSYAQQMETEGAVIASFTARRAEIAKQIAAVSAKENLKPIDDEALLDEVTALVERPNVLVGQFEKEFLEVPPECLILTMKANQKYFPLLDAGGKLTNKFLIVSNIRPEDPSRVIGGNERVVRPRLADAKFFFDQDRKKTLASRVEGLRKVVYHNKMGDANDMRSRVARVSEGAEKIGIWLSGEDLGKRAHLAASLSKADLLSDMVGEFPELQGIMGRYYAQHDRERYAQQPGITPQKSYYEKYFTEEIPFAIEDHYKPRFAGDDLPRNQVGIVVALADKLETLVGMFGIGENPTGDKDPFALRRNALGVIRILTEGNIPVELDKLIWNAHEMLKDDGLASRAGSEKLDRAWDRASQDANVKELVIKTSTPDFVENWFDDLQGFIFERFVGLLREQNFSAQEIDSVLSLRPQLLMEVPKRLAAVRTFAALPEAAALAAANKRVGNILKKAVDDFALRLAQGERIEVNADLLQEPAEQALHKALSQIAPKADAAFAAGDYTASLQALAGLRVPVDAFFDSVMVNTEDAALRANRLALLKQLHAAMNRVADISKLAA
jgi:glycyl-tRNA synthetase beta chain